MGSILSDIFSKVKNNFTKLAKGFLSFTEDTKETVKHKFSNKYYTGQEVLKEDSIEYRSRLLERRKKTERDKPKSYGYISIKLDDFSATTINDFDEILKRIKTKNIGISLDHGILSEEKITQLENFQRHISKKYGINVGFIDGFTFYSYEDTMKKNMQLNKVVEEINNKKIDGRELSPLEKFYAAYEYVTQYSYKEVDSGDNKDLSRSLLSVVDGNYIVCVGYANLLSAICNKLGILCTPQNVEILKEPGQEFDNTPTHATCAVYIDDPIYNIKGLYYSDPCWDSKNAEFSLFHSLLPYKDLDLLFNNRLKALDYKDWDFLSKVVNIDLMDTKSLVKDFMRINNEDELKRFFEDFDECIEFLKKHQTQNGRVVLDPTDMFDLTQKLNIGADNQRQESLNQLLTSLNDDNFANIDNVKEHLKLYYRFVKSCPDGNKNFDAYKELYLKALRLRSTKIKIEDVETAIARVMKACGDKDSLEQLKETIHGRIQDDIKSAHLKEDICEKLSAFWAKTAAEMLRKSDKNNNSEL